MGSSEMDTSPKEAKEAKESKPPNSQEQTSTTSAGPVNPDWSGFQAYSPMPPPGFMASGPQGHPYMWGVQGSYPFSPFAMPSPNGVAEAAVSNPGNVEVDGKSSEGKEKLPIKRSRGSLGSLNMITGKNNGPGKTSGASANGVHSKSAESGSEGSSEGSDAHSQNESPMNSGGRQDSADTSQNGNAAHGSQNGGTGAPNSMINQTMAIMPTSGAGGIPGPTTNLNIGMDYWGAASSASIPAMHGKVPVSVAAGSRDSIQSQMWIQDERELKRQKRKQSNRESARRSRLRKQAECDELAQRAEVLKEENASLRAEVNRIRSEYEHLLAQNASLKERLGEVPGEDDPRTSRDDHLPGKKAQHSSQTESQ